MKILTLTISLILGITFFVDAQNHFDYKIIKMDASYDTHVDSKLQKYVQRQKKTLDQKMNEVIGQCTTTMTSFAPASPLSNFLTDLLLNKSGQYTNDPTFKQCDLALLNFGGIRSQLSSGNVTIGNIYSISPFDNYIVFLEIKGSELRKALNRFRPAKNDAPFAGAQIVYQGDYPSKILIQGKAIDNDKLYRIVTLNFISEGGDNILKDVHYERSLYTNTIFRDFLVTEIREMTRGGLSITPISDNRVDILPTPQSH